MKRTYKRYTKEQKTALLDELKTSGMSVDKFAKKHGVSVGSLNNWKSAKTVTAPKKSAMKTNFNPVEKENMDLKQTVGILESKCEMYEVAIDVCAKQMRAAGIMPLVNIE
jgi:transposase-like protein